MKTPADLNQQPRELSRHIIAQDYTKYTPIDQACWRYILRVNRLFFAENAHPKYLEGLTQTGISVERIPRIEEIDRSLQKLGWRAVAVSGFIPPHVFLELQAMGVLPIACDMRTLKHIAYTPAPDIVHEAAGHAPLLVDPEYSAYLRKYGEIARKAIFSSEDMAVYEAIRALSVIKEEPSSTAAQIQEAQDELERLSASNTYISEATLLGRMAWWTTEYGLIQQGRRQLIFGAGLLSSAGESYHSMSEKVLKIPFTLDCINVAYDITRPQPQLFVTPDFSTLSRELDALSAQMAFRRGGLEGLAKAKMARTVTTTTLDSGLQIAGQLTEILAHPEPFFLRYSGPTQLAYHDVEIENHGVQTHHQGFSSPLGRLKGSRHSPADLSPAELQKRTGSTRLEFESGIVVAGRFTGSVRRGERNLILSFEDCTVRLGDQILYRPEWGIFDMACGEKVVSVSGGAADRARYLISEPELPKPQPKSNLTPDNAALNSLYAQVRQARETGEFDSLTQIAEMLEQKHPTDWLLPLEILELASKRSRLESLRQHLSDRLQNSQAAPEIQILIRRGMDVLAADGLSSEENRGR